MKKWMAFLLAMLMLLTMAAVPAMAEEDEVTLPDLSFVASGEGVAGWTGVTAEADLKTDGVSPDGENYLTVEKRVQIVQTDYIPIQAEPAIFEIFYKSDMASATAVYIQYYDGEKEGLGQSATTLTDGSGVWRKNSTSIYKEGAAYFKIWLRNLKAEATVSFAAPKLYLQSEGNAFLNGDMQEYTESEGVVIPSSWTRKTNADGGAVTGVREANGNVYISLQGGTSNYQTYLQQRVTVQGNKAYRLSFKLRNNLTLPAVQVYLYGATVTESLGNAYITMTAVGTPSSSAWTEYEAYITTQVDSKAAGYVSVFLRNPSAGYTADIDEVSLTASKTNFAFSEAEGNVTAKAHMVAATPKTDDSAPVLILCAYTGKTLTDVKVVSGEKADIALTAAGQFTASATVAAPTGTVVKAFAWDGIASMKPLGRATK